MPACSIVASWRANSAMSSVDLLAALEQLRLLADALGQHALAAQVRFDRGLGDGQHLALDALALLVGAFPDEGVVAQKLLEPWFSPDVESLTVR